MAHLAAAAMVAGTVLSAVGARNEGIQADRAASYEADQLENNANQGRAISQRQAIEERRKATLLESTLRNRAAASGGGGDVGVIDLAQDIDAQGEYNAMSALYEGEEKGRNLEGAASVRRWEGKNARKAGNLKAISTVLSSAGSMYGKYGGGGFTPNAGGGMSVPGTSGGGGWSSTPYNGNKVTWNTK